MPDTRKPDAATPAPDPLEIQFVRLDARAVIPRRAYDDDAGYDLFSLEDTRITWQPEMCRPTLNWIRTGIAVAIPPGCYGRIVGRSSAATKGFHVIEGVMDAGYRGEQLVRVCPIWHGQPGSKWTIEAGESLAQLIVHRIPPVTMVEVDELPPSERGLNGWGSSG